MSTEYDPTQAIWPDPPEEQEPTMHDEFTITITTAFDRRMPVEVRDRRHGGIVLIRLASGVEAWVKAASLKREIKTERTRMDALLDPKPVDPVVEAGMYEKNGQVYKVQKSRESGNLYAKRLTPINADRLTEEGRIVRYEFVYDPGSIRSLSASDRMSVEEAKMFGILHGVCCVCGITLVDAKSVAAGIGPVCAKRV